MTIRHLRLMALLEGTSLLVLFFVAMPLKYQFGMPEATKIIGSAHGVLFIAYISMLVTVTSSGKLPAKLSPVGAIAAFLPFGTWVFEQRVLKKI